ncbi:MAG: acyltransferase, partial [Chloroflexi bacterium]|nr:acyltransferase [Chloroflexota bacterium]
MDPRRAVSYLPGVDGLRALAVIAVFVHHAHAPWLPGGYLGVDLFFVISGFVITRGLLAEWDRGHRIDVRDFWRRRARRLLPAVYALILVTLAVYELWFVDDVRALAQLALASAAYVANLHLIVRDTPYFETIGPPSPLQHLWSLAVEEQFYLVWPLLLVALLRVRGRALVAAACLALAAASFAWTWQLSASAASQTRIYYGSDTHATGLLFGAALACVPTAALAQRRGVLANLLALGALAGLGLLAVWLAAWRLALYPWAFGLTGLLGGLAIAAAAHPTAAAARVLGCAPLRWLGLRSYSVYLWHWPVIVVTRRAVAEPASELALVLGQCVVTLALADLCYRCVEAPLRAGALGRWHARAGSFTGAVA